MHPETVDAAGLARKACQEMEAAAAPRGVTLAVDAGAEHNEVRADPAILRRVFDNLLGNALEHSPQGGTILVNVVSCDEGIEITVADQGPGVPEAFRERIFEKFQRLENRKTVPGANRGLGLTFCRLAIEAHGGTIWVDEAPGGGARFRALLPASEEAGATVEAAS